MVDRQSRARSFGAVADDYDRLRPSPPQAALDWLLPEDCRRAVDLGAGTGLFSRALASRVAEVVAVEPDERMRGVLRRRSADVRTVGGVSEAIPVRSGWADAVCASSAWHWMDPTRAVPEIARVLRPGGRFGLIWTSRDREVDWVRELDRLRTDLVSESDEQVAAQQRRHDVTLPHDSPFVDAELSSFTFERMMPFDDVIGWLGTYSVVIVASAEARAAGLGRVRAALRERFGDAAEITIPMRSWCWRATRRAGPTGS